MRIVLFVHSLASDWNHGNAHFLRGLMRALQQRGHELLACERWRNWSTDHLFEDHGARPLLEFARRFPDLRIAVYGGWEHILEEADALTRGADLVIVHEFNEPELVGAIGTVRRRRGDFALLFHDSHHRAVTAPHQIARLNLEGYDGVLAYGASLAKVYRRDFRRTGVHVFHEAADVTVFRPFDLEKTQDVVWIGNWDEERSGELEQYLIGAARELPELRFVIHGVRYPEEKRRVIESAGIEFRGFLPNYQVPEVFARSRVTLHVPRGPYLRRLPGIPTIRPFEAMACGIPLVSAPWTDSEGLFRAGHDYVLVNSPAEMRDALHRLSRDEEARRRLAEQALQTVRARHTCDHRAEQLEAIFDEIAASAATVKTTPSGINPRATSLRRPEAAGLPRA